MTKVVKAGLFGLWLLCLSFTAHAIDGEVREIQTGKAQDLQVSTTDQAEPVLALGRPVVTERRTLSEPGKALAMIGDDVLILAGNHMQMSSQAAVLSDSKQGSLELPGAADHLITAGSMAYAAGPDTLYVLERSGASLAMRGRIHLEVAVRAMAADDGQVYILRADNRLQVVDATDPTQPRILAAQTLPVIARSLQVRNGVLFLVRLR